MTLFRSWLAAALGAGLALSAAAAPAEIIFLRHAEKPAAGPELNAQGWKRAEALPALFLHDSRLQNHGLPVAIYAAGRMKSGSSLRSIQTMRATGAALRVKVDDSVTRDDLAGLVHAIRDNPAYEGKTVVVCWEHKKIPLLLTDFGWTSGPKQWNGEVFDRLWILDFEKGVPTRFRDLPQKLLPGDAAQ